MNWLLDYNKELEGWTNAVNLSMFVACLIIAITFRKRKTLVKVFLFLGLFCLTGFVVPYRLCLIVRCAVFVFLVIILLKLFAEHKINLFNLQEIETAKYNEFRRMASSQAKELVKLQKTTVDTLAILDAMMQLAPLGMAFFDMEGKCVRINNWFAEKNGFSVADHIGKHYKTLQLTTFSETFEQVILSKNPILNVECDIVINKENYNWQINFYPVNAPDGRELGIGVVISDITDIRVYTSELKARILELADIDKRKTEFLAMLAHELRNPLAPIMNSVYLLQISEGKTDFSEILQNSISMVQRQVKHMSRLLDDLLDIARLNRGKINLKKEPMDFADGIKNAVENNKDAAKGRNHELIVVLPDKSVLVNADPTRLEQVCNNLINNAIKYTEPGGKITVKLQVKDDWGVFSVIDNGIGITHDMLPRLFELFAQASRTLDRSQGGLGIGLALAQDIIRMHGGTISACSSGLNKGSEFTVRLPLLQVEELKINTKVSGMKRKSRKSPKSLNILVVDDNPDAADSLATLLRAAGHETQMVYDGATTLRKVHIYRPDVILLDIGLPGLNGYDVCSLLRESGYDGLVIAVTGYGTDEDRKKSKAAGINYHLTKPVEPEAIELIINGYAEKKVIC